MFITGRAVYVHEFHAVVIGRSSIVKYNFYIDGLERCNIVGYDCQLRHRRGNNAFDAGAASRG